MVWLVGIANAVNLIDGMDGLAGGIGAFAAAAMGAIALLQGSARGAVLAFALLGALLAFLLFNFPPARIFMGDSGSLFLGLTLAALPLAGGIPRSARLRQPDRSRDSADRADPGHGHGHPATRCATGARSSPRTSSTSTTSCWPWA